MNTITSCDKLQEGSDEASGFGSKVLLVRNSAVTIGHVFQQLAIGLQPAQTNELPMHRLIHRHRACKDEVI